MRYGAGARRTLGLTVAIWAVLATAASSREDSSRTITLPQEAPGAESTTHDGRAALRLTAVGGAQGRFLILPGVAFSRGVIELEAAGEVMAGVHPDVRGFYGLAFAVADERIFESFYVRATNGRSDDQLRRNHTVQYISEPDHPWQKLRAERTGQYESYADVGVGEWTRLRIEVDETRARLFVNGSIQPALTVPRLPNVQGGSGLGLWVGPGSIGYFRDLKVTPAT